MLLIGSAAAVICAGSAGEPALALAADPQLAQLLRGMALIKAGIVLAAMAAVYWRLGRPLSLPVVAAYAVGVWLLSGASMLVWQLTHIAAAAILFHAGLVGLLFVAWRDHRSALADRVA